MSKRGIAAIVLLMCAGSAAAEGIDHKWHYDNSGIWARRYQLGLVNGLVITESAAAIWEGGETRLGRTLWQGVDSMALGAFSSTALKDIVQRPRPTQSNDSDEMRQGKGHYSFPSGEVTAVAAAITPLVLEYGAEHPSLYALEALPAYDAIARLKSNAHWQTDVLAGLALGSGVGYLAHANHDTPVTLGVLPHGFSVGLKARF